MIRCYLTFGDLSSWLSLSPLKNLVHETGVSVTFEPLLGSMGNVAGSNRKPGEDDPLADYKARRAAAWRAAATRERERMAEMLDLDVSDAARRIDPTRLSLGLKFLEQQQADAEQVFTYLSLAFERTFRERGDVESVQAVSDLISACGVPSEGFETLADAGTDQLAAESEAALESGVYTAPAFVLRVPGAEDELFLGREHFPLLSWMLTGRQGTPPV